jgi:hypothetical protein
VSDKDDGNSQILVHVCEVIQNQLDISKEYTLSEELGREVISLVQALSFNVNDDFVNRYGIIGKTSTSCSICVQSMFRLGFFPRNRSVLMTLLHPSQPSWLLAQCGPLLVLLATRTFPSV